MILIRVGTVHMEWMEVLELLWIFTGGIWLLSEAVRPISQLLNNIWSHNVISKAVEMFIASPILIGIPTI